MRPREVFLSHADEDRAFASTLAEVLRLHDIPVWYSETEIRVAQQWHDEIGKALQRCDWFLLVLSPAAVEARWVKRELIYALEDPRYDEHIVCIDWRECDHRKLSWVLTQSQWIRCRQDDPEARKEAYRELLATWGLELKPLSARVS